MTPEALAAICELETAPVRELDVLIYHTISPGLGCTWEEFSEGMVFEKVNWCHRYTASIDAALTLVPETVDGGWRLTYDKPLARKNWAEVWLHENAEPGDGFYRSTAATPALALCAAALKSLSAQGIEAGTAETVKLGSVHESPVPPQAGCAQPSQPLSPTKEASNG